MGLISRVSSRTYRRLLTKMPDQAIAKNSRSASYAKKVLYKRKRWTTSVEKKAAEKTGQVGRAQRFYPTDAASRPPVPVNLTEPPRSSRRASFQVPSLFWSPADTEASSCFLKAARVWPSPCHWSIQ